MPFNIKEYYQKNKEKIKAQSKAYIKNNKERVEEIRAAYYQRHKELIKAKNKKYYEENKDHANAISKKYYKANKEKHRALVKEYYVKNKEKANACKKAWREANKDKISVHVANRRALKFRATIRLTELDKFVIEAVYNLAKLRTKQTGIQWHVDHIVPLTIGGLHKPTNLQVVPGSWNLSKGNRNCDVFIGVKNERC
jgi:hypothetical protein